MFKKILFIFLGLFLSQNAFSENTYPKDLSTFIEKRDLCDHFRGEISGEPDIDNERNLNAEMDKYCLGTDQELKKLKNKYKNSPDLLELLEIYDENIEPKTNNE